ncbi:MAG: zinc ABC transporter substrate-binding protein [Acetobacteraceae bacterium]|nr:zinc ABC transporter substrate-binding protein [Acetobacteraceae bacterium]
MITRRAALALPFALQAARARAEPGARSIVASFSILQDMVNQIAGDTVQTATLVPRNGDPHAFEPRPGDLAVLRSAAAMVENGLGLEGWLSRMVQASGFGGVRIVASTGIAPRSLQEEGATVQDPHIWQDPALGRQMVQTIAAGLSKAAPPRATAYAAAAARYAEELRRVEAEIARAVGAVPETRRKVLTTHDAFAYYGARFGIRFIAIEGISTEAEPSPRALARIAQQAKKDGLHTVFLENMTDPRLAEALAREAHLAVGPKLYSDSLSERDGPAATYLDLLRYNTAQLVASMRA